MKSISDIHLAVLRSCCCGVVLLFILAVSSPATGATVVSNLDNITTGTWNIFDVATGGPRAGGGAASSFTTGTSAVMLQSVTLSMGDSGISAADGGFTMALYSESGGLPSTILGTFTGSTNPFTAGLYIYTLSSPLALAASTTYDLVASVPYTAPDKFYKWNFTSDMSETSAAGWSIRNSVFSQIPTAEGNPGPWTEGTSQALMFSVQTTDAVPEASRAMLVLIGLGGVALRRKQLG